jgi:hypothetical protein
VVADVLNHACSGLFEFLPTTTAQHSNSSWVRKSRAQEHTLGDIQPANNKESSSGGVQPLSGVFACRGVSFLHLGVL